MGGEWVLTERDVEFCGYKFEIIWRPNNEQIETCWAEVRGSKRKSGAADTEIIEWDERFEEENRFKYEREIEAERVWAQQVIVEVLECKERAWELTELRKNQVR